MLLVSHRSIYRQLKFEHLEGLQLIVGGVLPSKDPPPNLRLRAVGRICVTSTVSPR